MTDLAKTLILLRKHSILNVYEMGSVYLDDKKFYGGGFQTYMPPCTLVMVFLNGPMACMRATPISRYGQKLKSSEKVVRTSFLNQNDRY